MENRTSSDSAGLYGLVLAGGKSSRMGRDKAALEFHGRPQLQVMFELLSGVCERVFVSDRADRPRPGYPRITDRFEGSGPILGIRSALAEHPDRAWLVVACDLPLLDRPTLDALIAGRDPGRIATAFVSARDGWPEPLCAIYEPSAARHLAGHGCPRKALIQSDARLLPLPNPRALDNVNTPDDLAAVAPKTVEVRFVAMLREQRGRVAETLRTRAGTAAQLYEELGLALPRRNLRVAVNDEFAAWEHPLRDGDRVLFVPPTAGG